MPVSDIERMRIILREKEVPFFTDDELDFYLQENGGNVNAAIYQCCIIKAEDTSLDVSGLSTPDTAKYYLRLAQRYRPSNSGVLEGF